MYTQRHSTIVWGSADLQIAHFPGTKQRDIITHNKHPTYFVRGLQIRAWNEGSKISQLQRRPLGPSPGWKRLLANTNFRVDLRFKLYSKHLKHYGDREYNWIQMYGRGALPSSFILAVHPRVEFDPLCICLYFSVLRTWGILNLVH